MAHREGRPRSNEFRLPHVCSVYVACADDTEVIIPHNMWHKHSMLRGSSSVNLGSRIPQSGSTNKVLNGTVDIDRVSAGIIGAQERSDLRLVRQEHAIQTVIILPVIQSRTNERSRLILWRTCIVMVSYRPRSWIGTRCNEIYPSNGYWTLQNRGNLMWEEREFCRVNLRLHRLEMNI